MTLNTHKKRRIQIIVERPMMKHVLELVDRSGATGYTVFPTIAGRGQGGAWEEGDVSSALDRVMVFVVAAHDVADKIMTEAAELLGPYQAIILASDVDVLRGDRF